MSTDYKIKVNDAFDFEFQKENISKLDAVSIEANHFHILHQNIAYQAEIISSHFDTKKYTVKVNNNAYQVAIFNPLDTLIKAMGFEEGKVKLIDVIKAPMPGLILEMNIVVGQTVKEGDLLFILTAMKMENSYHSPREGVIKSIAVNVGDTVIKGDLLIEFE